MTPSSASRSAALTASSSVMPQAMIATSSPSWAIRDAADAHVLVRRGAHRGLAAQRADERDAVAVGQRGHELRRLVGVARVQDGRAVDRAQRGDVLQRHLRRAVLADRDAGVRAARARASRCEIAPMRTKSYARERNAANVDTNGVQPRTCMPDRGRHELLLGDEHLEVAVRVRLAEVLGVRRVRDLAVERDDVAADVGQRGDRLAVGLAGRDLVAELVGRQRRRPDVSNTCGVAGLGLAPRRRSGRARRRAPRSPPRRRRAACRACRAGPRPP